MPSRIDINLLHILIVGPLLIYLGWQKCQIPDWVWTLLIVLGVVVMGYHGYLLYSKLN